MGSQVSSSDEKGGGFDVGSAHHGEVAAAIRDHSFAASIIVPAYNEETRIRPLLPTLASAAQAWNYLVLVVCNGCTDRTAEIVRSIPGIYVLEIERPGKPHAVNVAEMVTGEIFPRLYVDADVQTERETFERLMQALQGEAPRAVRPTASYLLKGAPTLARAVYASRGVIPSSRRWSELHLEGYHIYGTNRSGRARFEIFPEDGQIMEDAFFDRMFDLEQKVVVHDAHVRVPLPTSDRALIRGMTRVCQGNLELTDWLTKHRPDRLATDAPERVERRSPLGIACYYLRGGSTFASWNPRVVVDTLLTLGARRAALARARHLRTLGQQADWR